VLPLSAINIPNWKLLEQPVLPAQGTSIDLAPFIIMFVLLAASALLMVQLGRRQWARHIVQFAAACAFILGVSPCACMFRDMILGCQKINLDNLFAFRALIIICTVIAFSLVFGRTFCSWICPLGSLQELAASASERVTNRMADGARSTLRYACALGALALVVAGFLVFRPDTFIFIEMAMVFWIMALFLIVLFDLSNPAYNRKLKLLRYVSLVAVGIVYLVGIYTGGPSCVMFRNSLDYSSIISAIGVLIASLAVGRAWCKFLCPEGALFGLLTKVSLWRVAKTGECSGCGTCGRACPMSAVEKGQIDDTSCIVCGRCVDGCPGESLEYRMQADPGRDPEPLPVTSHQDHP